MNRIKSYYIYKSYKKNLIGIRNGISNHEK